MNGNIGDQLFKYAAARNFSLIYRVNLFVDLSWYIKNRKLKLEPNIIAIENYNTTFRKAGSVIINHFLKTKQAHYLNRFPETANYKVIIENKKEFSNDLYISNPPFYMIGDYRNEKYFEENIDQLIEDFIVDPLKLKKISSFIKRFETVNSIAIFIQSKYLNKNHSFTIIDIDWSYYKSAIKYFKSFISNPHFVLFTDIENFDFDILEIQDSKELIPLYQNDQEWKNIYLMSKCKCFIADNSSTSWWAAWLNFTPNRTVVIPQNFSYNYPEITHSKLGIQQNWIKL